MEQREANRLLERGIPVELDVRAVPDVGQILALGREETVPTGPARGRERQVDLVASRGERALTRPS